GPFRTGDKLAAALERIRRMQKYDLRNLSIDSQGSFNLDIQDWFELRAMLTTAEAVVSSALARSESRGAHQREDFPEPDPSFEKNQVLELKDGELHSRWLPPVRFKAS
ncbi:MAG TPA: succinate dehydrogenase, partial [Candidatus Binatia bacterium]|nr:succinate dehydrogenase [Candidatus Binatia bacterium]